MATVRFSKELQDEIIKRAKAVFDKQLETAKNSRPNNEWADKIYTTLFGQHVPALNAVPQEFLYMVDNIEVDRVGSANCGLRFDFPSKRAWVREFTESEYAKRASSYSSNSITLKDHLVWGELFVEVKEWQTSDSNIKGIGVWIVILRCTTCKVDNNCLGNIWRLRDL